MPSTTRGSILISTANDIGEALVDKLGGVGYSPNEWKDKFNLCGIAPVDSAPALSVLSDSAGTGDERGSILIATADAIGAILNKKYNVLHGFKPKEWASACRKMKALEEGSVASASIASFSDGADTVPITSCVCNIDANLGGKSAVNAVHARKNLLNDSEKGFADGNIYFGHNSGTIFDFSLRLKAGTYTYSIVTADGTATNLYIRNSDTNTSITGFPAYNTLSKTFTLDEDTNLAVWCYKNGYTALTDIISAQIEVGSTATTYEAYSAETKTADLGRAVYGGSADIITGEGSETHKEYTLDNLTWSGGIVGGAGWCWYVDLSADGLKLPANSEIFSGLCNNYTPIRYNGVATTQNTIALRSNGYLYVNNGSETTEPTGKVTIELATPTDFTFEPVKIDSFPGVNNIWNDCGNTAVEYYKAPTPYTRKTATGGIANFSDQRTDLPLTKAIANIAPSIAGKSAVNLYQGKKNLFDNTGLFPVSGSVSSYYFKQFDVSSGLIPEIHLKEGVTYTFAVDVTSTIEPFNLSVGCGNGVYSTDILTVYNKNSGRVTITFAPTAAQLSNGDVLAFRCPRYGAQNTFDYSISNAQLEVGSSASAYVPYQAPTTYTAELGETVYGGSVDFVSGEVVKDCTKGSMSSAYLSGLNSDYIGYEASTAYFGNHPSIWVRNWNYQTAAARTAGGIKCACEEFPASMNNTTIFASQYRIYFDVNGKNISSVQDFIDYVANLEQNGKQLEITYELATPIESTIPGRVISPIDGVNNYWNDAGGDTEIQYFENET